MVRRSSTSGTIMKLSGMRDGPKKTVTVPGIPGQLGPMRLSPMPREKGSAESFILTRGYGVWFQTGYRTKIQWARLLWRDDLARFCNDIHKGWAFLSYSWARRVAPLLLTWNGGESNWAHLWKVGVFVRLSHINWMRCISTLFSVMLSNCCASSPRHLCRDRYLFTLYRSLKSAFVNIGEWRERTLAENTHF